MAYFYSLGPWHWQNDAWTPPTGTVGVLDFGTYEDCATPGDPSRLTRPVGFFATMQRLGSGYAFLGEGDCRELPSTQRMRDTFAATLRYRPTGRTLAALCTDTLIAGDPTGQERWKPLMPQADLTMGVVLAPHGDIHREPFRWGQNHTQQVQAVLHEDIGTLYHHVESGRMPLAGLQRVLDGLMQQYAVEDWHVFVPALLHRSIPGPLPRATTLTDNFNRADSTSLGTGGEGWSWTEVLGDLKILTNRLAADSAGHCRAESDLSGADMVAKSDFNITTFESVSLLVRHANAADTCYQGQTISNISDYTSKIYKRVAGVATELGTATFFPTTLTHKIEVSGSLVTYWSAPDTTQRVQVTDTAITGNLRAGAGIGGTGSITWEDNWQANDVVIALTGQLVWLLSGISGVTNVILLKGTSVSAAWVLSGGASHTYSWVFGDVTRESGFVSTATTSIVTRTYQFAGGDRGQRRVSSTVSSLASAAASTLTSAVLIFVGGIATPSLWDGIVQKESQKYRRTYPI